jgi:hypothetical protein
MPSIGNTPTQTTNSTMTIAIVGHLGRPHEATDQVNTETGNTRSIYYGPTDLMMAL